MQTRIGRRGLYGAEFGAAGPLARSAHDLTLAMDILAAPLRAFGPRFFFFFACGLGAMRA